MQFLDNVYEIKQTEHADWSIAKKERTREKERESRSDILLMPAGYLGEGRITFTFSKTSKFRFLRF